MSYSQQFERTRTENSLFPAGGIAVDWVHNQVFYTAQNEIGVYDIATNSSHVLISDRITNPRDVAEDPLNG